MSTKHVETIKSNVRCKEGERDEPREPKLNKKDETETKLNRKAGVSGAILLLVGGNR